MNIIKKIKPLSFIVFLTSFSILCFLGTWQMQRLNWKNNMIKQIDHQLTLDPILLPKDRSLYDSLSYRKIKLKGKFLHEKEMHLYAGSRAYKSQPGYLILTPMELEDGEFMLVNRGWVPEKKKNSIKRPETINNETQEIEGYLLAGEKRTWSTLDNDIAKNLWLWVDMEAMSGYSGKDLGNHYVMAKKHPSDKLPLGRIIKTQDIKNDHLSYAITWYGLAISLVVIYFMLLRRME